jgi:hypothetical protein
VRTLPVSTHWGTRSLTVPHECSYIQTKRGVDGVCAVCGTLYSGKEETHNAGKQVTA